MGILTSKISAIWNGSETNGAHAAQELYNDFVKDVLNAIRKGNCERLKQLQEESVMMLWGGIESINITPSVVQTAAVHGHVDVLQYLLDLGIDVDQTDTCGMSPLHEACKGNNLSSVQLLVSRSRNIDLRDVWGRTPLIKALVYRNTEAAELLLERGANPNAVDIYGITPLSTAIDYNLIDMLKVLVRHGADINLITQHIYKCSGPPLYQAINNQNLAVVKELIQLGANTQPRLQDYGGNNRGGVAGTWHYFSSSISFPTLQHANAVLMAMSELVKRSHNVEISGPGMDILMALLAAHGHPLGSYLDVMIRVLINSHPKDFSMLLQKLHVCSSHIQDNFLTGNGDRAASQRPQARPQHLQQLDHHLSGAADGNQVPRFVMSLENQARRVARQAVMASGRNVVWAVRRLQCPPALKSLLLLKDIDKVFSPNAWKAKSIAVV